MRCEACQGDGWRKRLAPHPGVPGTMVTVTRLCTFCQGKGIVPEYQPCGKDHAANDLRENDQ